MVAVVSRVGPEHGYLLYLDASLAPSLTDLGPARETAAKLQDLGRSLRVPALTSLALVLAGLADLRSGSTASGFWKTLQESPGSAHPTGGDDHVSADEPQQPQVQGLHGRV